MQVTELVTVDHPLPLPCCFGTPNTSSQAQLDYGTVMTLVVSSIKTKTQKYTLD
jgi:hypothetical protein